MLTAERTRMHCSPSAAPLLAACIASVLVMQPLSAQAQRGDGTQPRTPVEQSAGETQGVGRAQPKTFNDPKAYPRAEARRIMTTQRPLIDARLEAFPKRAPTGRDAKARVFFLGIAAFAEQDVFNREVRSVRAVMDKQFGTRNRSLLLINHPETIDDHAIADHDTIAYALKGFAARMDVETDILVLYITTHGLPEKLALSHGNLVSTELKARELQRLLDQSGIKNRVLILSACHAGSFIERLENPDTLILAAARADRTSFGCSNERAWTFFGDALVNQGLRRTPDFTEAFKSARTLISGWEKAEGFEPSLPQISMGRRIKTKLDALAESHDRD